MNGKKVNLKKSAFDKGGRHQAMRNRGIAVGGTDAFLRGNEERQEELKMVMVFGPNRGREQNPSYI